MTAVFTLINARPHTHPSETGLRHARATSALGSATPTNTQTATPVTHGRIAFEDSTLLNLQYLQFPRAPTDANCLTRSLQSAFFDSGAVLQTQVATAEMMSPIMVALYEQHGTTAERFSNSLRPGESNESNAQCDIELIARRVNERAGQSASAVVQHRGRTKI